MSLLKTIKPEEAKGSIKEIYEQVKSVFKKVPNVIQLYTINPRWLPKQMEYLQYFSEHPKLNVIYWAYTRLLVSHHLGGQYCVRLNTAVLQYSGVSKNDIERAINNPADINLPKEQKALLLLALKFINNPEAVSKDDIDLVKELGWTESDIFDAVFHATTHAGYTYLLRGLKPEIDF